MAVFIAVEHCNNFNLNIENLAGCGKSIYGSSHFQFCSTLDIFCINVNLTERILSAKNLEHLTLKWQFVFWKCFHTSTYISHKAEIMRLTKTYHKSQKSPAGVPWSDFGSNCAHKFGSAACSLFPLSGCFFPVCVLAIDFLVVGFASGDVLQVARVDHLDEVVTANVEVRAEESDDALAIENDVLDDGHQCLTTLRCDHL